MVWKLQDHPWAEIFGNDIEATTIIYCALQFIYDEISAVFINDEISYVFIYDETSAVRRHGSQGLQSRALTSRNGKQFVKQLMLNLILNNFTVHLVIGLKCLNLVLDKMFQYS